LNNLTRGAPRQQGQQLVRIGKREYRLAYSHLFRPLSADERQRLKESIQSYGIQMAVMVDEADHVIDGGHRLEIAAELGLESVPVTIIKDLNAEQKKALALSLNRDRRHLTLKEQKAARLERVQRVAKKRQQGKSLRAIAQEEGVSESQVRQDVGAATAQGCALETPKGKIIGLDGKERRARKTKPAAGAHPCAPEPDVAVVVDDVVVDEVGLTVPDHLLPVFAARKLFAEALSLYKQLTAKLNEIASLDDVADGCLRRELSRRERGGKPYWQHAGLEELGYALETWEPHVAHCPWCLRDNQGQFQRDCKACHGRDWVPLKVYQQASPEDRARVEGLVKK
jgi:hypothetical protein